VIIVGKRFETAPQTDVTSFFPPLQFGGVNITLLYGHSPPGCYSKT